MQVASESYLGESAGAAAGPESWRCPAAFFLSLLLGGLAFVAACSAQYFCRSRMFLFFMEIGLHKPGAKIEGERRESHRCYELNPNLQDPWLGGNLMCRPLRGSNLTCRLPPLPGSHALAFWVG